MHLRDRWSSFKISMSVTCKLPCNGLRVSPVNYRVMGLRVPPVITVWSWYNTTKF